jgi:hypothetical protein
VIIIPSPEFGLVGQILSRKTRLALCFSSGAQLPSQITGSGHERKLSKTSPFKYSSTLVAQALCKSASDCLSRSSRRLNPLALFRDRRSLRFEEHFEIVEDQSELKLASDIDDVGRSLSDDIDVRGEASVEPPDTTVLSLENDGRTVA